MNYTEAGTIRLSLRPGQGTQADTALEFVVEDTGVGIPGDRLSQVFEAFIRHPHDEMSARRSSGLGLAICHRLCALMGGSITVESEPGVGSRFTVVLPFAIAEPPAPTAERPAAEAALGAEPVRVLVAEDNRVNQRLLELMLAKLSLTAASWAMAAWRWSTPRPRTAWI